MAGERFGPPLALTRAMWEMPGPVGPADIKMPVRDVFLHHSVTPITSAPLHDARKVAQVGVARFGRCSYSAMVHPARVVFWAQLEKIGAHTAGRNSTSVGLVLIGNYQTRQVPPSMIYDACWALNAMRAYGIVSQDATVRAHRSVTSTACPGKWAVDEVLPLLRAVMRDPNWRP